MTVTKPWLAHYDEGVPAEINPDKYQSIAEVFNKTCEKFADKRAFSNFDYAITYRELEGLTRDFAAYLQQDLGLRKGDRIALMMPNILQYPIALYAALRIGLVVVNVNPLYTSRELIHQLNDTGTRAILVLSNFAHTLEQALPAASCIEHVVVTHLADVLPCPKRCLMNFAVKYIKRMIPAWSISRAVMFRQAMARGRRLELQSVEIHGDDLAFLQPTSGTTGIAKSAMLTHRNMVANMEQMIATIKSVITEDEVMITALPLYHIFSLCVNTLTFFEFGGESVLITNPRDIPGFIKTLSKVKFTAITGVNTLYNALLQHKDFRKLDFSNLRFPVSGGMSLQESVAQDWQSLTGTTIIEGYGLTESSPVLTVNPLSTKTFTGSIGLPVPSTEIRIVDDEGNELPMGERGELQGRGPQVMEAYWQRPEETRKVLSSDGWLSTGDIATMDESGRFYIVDRKKNIVIVSGFNVYPNELEDVIASMEGIAEVAVIGIPYKKSGERLKAFVVKNDPSLTEQQVIEFCKERLTPYKIPKFVEFRDELPKTNVGKILHRALREEAENK